MGNCMETCHQTWRTRDITSEEKQPRFEHDEVRQVQKSGDAFDGDKGVMRVKIVLTREELELLMAQLSGSTNKGGLINNKRSLEKVLEEIERGRRSLSLSSSSSSRMAATWSPSLESIMEIPEVPDHMAR